MLGFHDLKSSSNEKITYFNVLIFAGVFTFAFVLSPLMGEQIVVGQSVEDDYRLAAGHYSRGSFNDSRDAFSKLIQQYPGTEKAVVSHFFLGESEVQLQNYEVAYSQYQAFLAQRPGSQHSARALFRLGECAYQLGRQTQAASLLEKFVWTYPNDPLREFALTFLGDVRMQRGEPQLAQRVYENALQAYPQSSMSQRCRFGLARAVQQLGNYEDASRFYQLLISQAESPYRGQSLMQLGVIDFNNGHVENARSNLFEALPLLTSDEEILETKYWLARSELACQDFEAAFGYLDSVADDVPRSDLGAAILFDGAVAAAKTDRVDVAQRWLSRLRDGWPNSRWSEDALQMQIDLANQTGDSNNSLGWIEQFEKEFPESSRLPGIIEYGGRVQYEEREYKKSIETFQRLLDRFAGDAPKEERSVWQYYIGLGYLGLKDYNAAKDALFRVKAVSHDSEFKASVSIAKATALIGLGRNIDATPYLQQYLDIEPSGAQAARARSELAIAYARDQQWDLAKIAFDDLQQKHVDDPLVFETASIFAESAYKAKNHRFAESYYEILADCGDEKYSERGLSGLAWARMEGKQPQKAIETFGRLLNEFPDSRYAPEAAMARGKSLEEQKEYVAAANVFGLVVERHGDSKFAGTAALRQAYNLQKAGSEENLKVAKHVLLKYLESAVGDARGDAIYQLAWVCSDLGLEKEGLQRFEELSSEYRDSRYWVDATYRIAKQAVSVEDYSKADRLLTQLLAHDSPVEVKSRCLFLRGQIAAKQKNWVLVTETMTELVSKTKDKSLHAKASYWLGESLYQCEQYSGSADVFGPLVRREEFTSKKLKPWIHLRYAQCLAYQERWTPALTEADAGLKRFADFRFRYEFDYIRGRALASQGRLQDARAAYQKVTKSPEGASTETAAMAQWRIGETFFHQEEYRQAIDAYYKVDSLFAYKKWRSAALMQAGKCQEHLGNWRHAIKLYKQLVEKFPGSEYVKDANQRMDLAVRQASLKQKANR